jgi:hypothetical protein
MGTHKITGEIYIGYREINTVPSHLDLPKYKTSSKTVKPIFNEFNWIIVAEFFTGDDAFDTEQKLIAEQWNNPDLLNQHYRLSSGKKRFRCDNKGRTGQIPWNKGIKLTDEQKRALPPKPKGIKRPQEHREAISKAKKGKPSPLKGKVGCFKDRKRPIPGLKRNRKTKQSQ